MRVMEGREEEKEEEVDIRRGDEESGNDIDEPHKEEIFDITRKKRGGGEGGGRAMF